MVLVFSASFWFWWTWRALSGGLGTGVPSGRAILTRESMAAPGRSSRAIAWLPALCCSVRTCARDSAPHAGGGAATGDPTGGRSAGGSSAAVIRSGPMDEASTPRRVQSRLAITTGGHV